MTWLYALLWWFSGFLGMLWLSRSELTWFQLLIVNPLIGIFGPLLPVIIALCMLAQADFWSEPVFKEKTKREDDQDPGC